MVELMDHAICLTAIPLTFACDKRALDYLLTKEKR